MPDDYAPSKAAVDYLQSCVDDLFLVVREALRDYGVQNNGQINHEELGSMVQAINDLQGSIEQFTAELTIENGARVRSSAQEFTENMVRLTVSHEIRQKLRDRMNNYIRAHESIFPVQDKGRNL